MNMRPTGKPWLPAVDLSLMSTPKLVEDFYERIWNEGIWMPQQSCSHRNSRSVAHSERNARSGSIPELRSYCSRGSCRLSVRNSFLR